MIAELSQHFGQEFAVVVYLDLGQPPRVGCDEISEAVHQFATSDGVIFGQAPSRMARDAAATARSASTADP